MIHYTAQYLSVPFETLYMFPIGFWKEKWAVAEGLIILSSAAMSLG